MSRSFTAGCVAGQNAGDQELPPPDTIPKSSGDVSRQKRYKITYGSGLAAIDEMLSLPKPCGLNEIPGAQHGKSRSSCLQQGCGGGQQPLFVQRSHRLRRPIEQEIRQSLGEMPSAYLPYSQ